MKNVATWLRTHAEVIFIPLTFLILYYLSSKNIFNPYFMQVIMLAGINVIVTQSLNILNGMTGLSSLGHAGFMSVGAYSAAFITSVLFKGVPMPEAAQIAIFLTASILGGFVAALCGLIIGFPTLRLRGDYLAIVTLGFCEVIRALMRLIRVTGGSFGLTGIRQHTTLFWVFLFMMLAIYACRNFMDSSFGRACMAIRENEIAASTIGINTSRYKITAFATSAFIAGVAGGLFAHLVRYLHPDIFGYAKSTDFLVYLYAGGVGSISGSLLGAVILTVLPETLRFLSEWRLVIYGALLLFIILFRRRGMFGGREFAFLKLNTGGIQVFGIRTIKSLFRSKPAVGADLEGGGDK